MKIVMPLYIKCRFKSMHMQNISSWMVSEVDTTVMTLPRQILDVTAALEIAANGKKKVEHHFLP